MSQNQNKSILLDGLIAAILREKEENIVQTKNELWKI